MNSDNILVYNLYNSLVDACNTGTNNWAKGVKKSCWITMDFLMFGVTHMPLI